MQRSDDLSYFVSPLNTALQRYQMNCPQRIAVFLAQVRHETASLTVFHQPLDNGAGSLHMIPSNWGYVCSAIPEVASAFGCSDCSCVSQYAADPLGSATTAAAKRVFAQPLIAFLSGAWWFAQGASTPAVFGWKGCGDLRLDADVGLGGIGPSDCHHTGYYQVTCCIFWTIGGSAGLQQRITYYNTALSVARNWGTSLAVEEVSDNQSPPKSNTEMIVASCIVGGILLITLIAVIVIFSRRLSRIESV